LRTSSWPHFRPAFGLPRGCFFWDLVPFRDRPGIHAIHNRLGIQQIRHIEAFRELIIDRSQEIQRLDITAPGRRRRLDRRRFAIRSARSCFVAAPGDQPVTPRYRSGTVNTVTIGCRSLAYRSAGRPHQSASRGSPLRSSLGFLLFRKRLEALVDGSHRRSKTPRVLSECFLKIAPCLGGQLVELNVLYGINRCHCLPPDLVVIPNLIDRMSFGPLMTRNIINHLETIIKPIPPGS